MSTFKERVDAQISKKQNLNRNQLSQQTSVVDFEKESKKQWWNPVTWVASANDLYKDLQRGAVSSIEGIADFAISQVGGAVADLFRSDSLEKEIEKITKYDVTGAIMDKPLIGNNSLADISNGGIFADEINQFTKDNTLVKEGGTVEQVAQGIGGMLPAVAIGALTKNPKLGTIAFGTSAGGQSTQEALNEGASLGGARAYGIGSALLETTVEALSGGVGGLGTGALQKVAPKLTKNVVAKYIGNVAGEAAEEMISEWANPYLKRATYDEDAETASLDEILNAGKIGALTGGIMQGGTLVNLAKYGVKGEQALNTYNEILELNQEEYDLNKKGELTQEKRVELKNKKEKLLVEFSNTIGEIKSDVKRNRVQTSTDIKGAMQYNSGKQLAQETVDLINKRTGGDLKIEFTKDPTHNGSFNSETNTITIDENAENPYSIVLGHEVTHYTESNSNYSNLYNEVVETIGETKLAQEREKLRTYKDYKDMSDENLNKEIVANYISENFFTNFKQAQKLISNNKTLGSRIISFIKDKIARIGKNSAEYKELKNIETRLQEIMDNKEVNLANNSELALQYKVKKYPHFNSRSEIKKELRKEINSTLNDLYSNTENNTLDDVAVQDGNKVYLIDTSREENGYSYGAYEVIEFADEERAKEFKEAKNDDIRRKEQNAQSDESVKKQKLRLGDNREVSDYSREDRSSARDTGKQSSNNFERVSREDANNGVKYSAKQTPATQEDVEVDETLRSKVKTQLIQEDMSWIESLKGLTDKGKQAVIDIYNNKDVLKSKLQILLTNSFAGVENELKSKIEQEGIEKGWTKKQIKEEQRKQVEEIAIAYNSSYRATSKAEDMIGTTLKSLWSGINKKGLEYTSDFELFLLHRLNIKRMDFSSQREVIENDYKNGTIDEEEYNASIEEIDNAKKKPVFGEEVSADKSREQVKALEKKHPEFVELANEVYKYLENLMNIRSKANIVNEKQIGRMMKWYGENGVSWYVPTYRDIKHGANLSGLSGNIGVTKGIHKAKGSDLDIQSIMLSMSEQTIGVHKQAAINELFLKVKEKLPEHFELVDTQKQTREDMNGEIEVEKDKNKNTTVYFYEQGNRVEYKCSSFIGVAFDSIRNQQSNFEKVLDNTTGKMVSLLKKFTTEYNPFFAVRNLFRDASDAFIYTKYSPNLISRYINTFKELKRGDNSGYYRLYMKSGGQNFSFFDNETGIKGSKKFKLLEKISALNEFTELMPRMSEFMESLKAQGYDNVTLENMDSIPQEVVDRAMYEASEVTVNFGRGGTFTKKMNRYLMPYLNASVQGWCKMYNTFVHPTSVRALGMTMAKMVVMALPTIIFNELLLGDDDEYEQLSDDIKGSYFLIPAGNNKFIRIPRGRVESVIGDAFQRTIRTAKGEENAFDGYVDNVLSNISPLESMSRTILSPITDVRTNTTWYGGNIENQSMLNKPINERYDNNTSSIAIALNKVFPNLSPKRWHYLLDQYSGIVGDIVLPMTSKNRDVVTTLTKASGFYANSLNNNKYTNQFYDMQEQLTQAKNSENATGVDDAKMRYFNKMNTKINALYKEKNSLTGDEADATQLLIVQMQKQTLESLKEFTPILEKYKQGLSTEELYEDYYREATRECFGAEIALKDYDSRIYEKATMFKACGIDWDTFYCAYFDAKEITPDYDENGDAISGSKKQKITQYVKSLKLTATQKYMIMGLLGYKNANGESQVRSALIKAGYTEQALKDALEICGY